MFVHLRLRADLAPSRPLPLPTRPKDLPHLEPRKEMRLGVDDHAIQWKLVFRSKQQPEVFERLREPETLHVVPVRWRDLVRIVEARVCVHGVLLVVLAKLVHDFGVRDEGLEHLPAPLAVHGIAGDTVEVEEAFDRLGALQVVYVVGMDVVVLAPEGVVGLVEGVGDRCGRASRPGTWWVVDVEMGYFRRETSRCGFVHAPAGLHELFGEVEVFVLFRGPVAAKTRLCFGNALSAGDGEGDGARHEAD